MSRLAGLLGRLPKPIVPLLPILFAFLGPGLILALVAFSIKVPYPQETMAPYPRETLPASTRSAPFHCRTHA